MSKNITVGQCVKMIVLCVILIAVSLFIPFSFMKDGAFELSFTFSKLPLIGNGEFVLTALQSLDGFGRFITMPETVTNILTYPMSYFIYVFYSILLIDLIFAIFLLIFKNNILRRIFRIFSIIFGILMIVIALCSVITILGFIGQMLSVNFDMEVITKILTENGLITFIALLSISCTMIKKQFTWFPAPYKNKLVIAYD